MNLPANPGLASFNLKDVEGWTQEGLFLDADGNQVGAYDDVVLLEPTLPENDPAAAYIAPAGTVGTVLFHCGVGDGLLELELSWTPVSTVIGYAKPSTVRLYRMAEEKIVMAPQHIEHKGPL
jgi:hypothetical protein